MRSLVLIAALALWSSSVASADIFTWSYSGSEFSASGTLQATSNGDGTYTAVDGAGVLNYSANPGGLAVTLYPIPPADVPATVRTGSGTDLIGLDNLLSPTGTPMLDVEGIIFGSGVFNPPPGGTISGVGFNVYYTGGTYQSFGAGIDNLGERVYAGDSGTFTLAAVPEPGATALLIAMLSGVVGLAGVVKNKLSWPTRRI